MNGNLRRYELAMRCLWADFDQIEVVRKVDGVNLKGKMNAK